jgi:hypothetical protein
MAAHAAVYFGTRRRLRLAVPIYTYGQPRVGNTAFAGWFVNATLPAPPSGVPWLRLVHWNDPVPHLGPKALGFRHFGTEVWLDEASDAAMFCNGSGEDPECSDSIEAALVFDDHCSYLGHRNCQCERF